MENEEPVVIYCDGACSGNQFSENKGGWGAVLLFKGRKKELYGAEKNTTNQKMELTACINALKQIKSDKYPVKVFSDSAYLVNCMQQKWYEKWQMNGWKTSKKQPVDNKELWQELIELKNKFNISFHKVKGHSGDIHNERADELANLGMEEIG
jgi:ribonuclease HI